MTESGTAQDVKGVDAMTLVADLLAMASVYEMEHDEGDERVARVRDFAARITESQQDARRLAQALETALVGGNHLAVALGLLMPDTRWERWNHIMAQQRSGGATYEVWCAWKACMDARDIAEGSKRPTHDEAPLPSLAPTPDGGRGD